MLPAKSRSQSLPEDKTNIRRFWIRHAGSQSEVVSFAVMLTWLENAVAVILCHAPMETARWNSATLNSFATNILSKGKSPQRWLRATYSPISPPAVSLRKGSDDGLPTSMTCVGNGGRMSRPKSRWSACPEGGSA